MRTGDGVEIAGEVKVDRLRRLNRAPASARRPTFAAKNRAHGGLSQCESHALADFL